MNCRRVISLLSAYIDGEISGMDMLAVRAHIGDCDSCREDYESLRATKQLLARMPTAAPRADLTKVISSRLDAVEMPLYLKLWSGVRAGLCAKTSPAFAVVAAVSVAFLVVGANGRTPHTYDVARVWQQIPKPVTLTLSDLGKGEFATSETYVPQSFTWEKPAVASQAAISFASVTQ